MYNPDILISAPAGALLQRLLLAAALMFGTGAEAAVPVSWNETAYAYDANNTPLSQALEEFARTFGVRLQLHNVEGTLSGRFRADSAQDYLERLALEHSFQWFLYNGTLYVSSLDEFTSANIEVSEDAVTDLKEALTQVGLLDERFGWGELPDEGMIMVSGPQKYIDFVRQTVVKKTDEKAEAEKEREKNKAEVMVFPLVYASVGDREITYRDRTLLLPGVATILNELLSNNGLPGTDSSVSSDIGERARQRMLERIDGDQSLYPDYDEPAAGQNDEAMSPKNKIGADIRNNAVLIHDNPKRRPVYEQLIAKLDVPRNLVEIDAIIFDIDRSKISELGIQWTASGGDGAVSVDPSGGAIPFLRGGSSATIVISDFSRFLLNLRALESEGDASLVASPSILTVENQPAVIDFNDTSYITAVGERVANIQSVTAGTSLRVIPRVIHREENSKLIQLSVDIEDGKLSQTNDVESPTVSRGSISTQTVISANRSLVVGGFHVAKEGDQVRKVPILGDLPLLRKFFTYKSKEHSKRERLFIITPRLMGNEVDPRRYTPPENRAASTYAHMEEYPQTDEYVRGGAAEYARNVPAEYVRNVPAEYVRNVPAEYVRNVPAEYVRNVPAEYGRNVPAEYGREASVERGTPPKRKFVNHETAARKLLLPQWND